MAIIKWSSGIDYSIEDHILEQEVLIAILSMTPEELDNPWIGDVVVKPRLKRVIVDIRKQVRGGEIYGKIGQEHSYDRGYYPGGMKLTMSGAINLIESDLKTLWLASRLGHHVLVNTKKEYGYK